MRKCKRFIKKFSKSFFCIVVAFVALINACFFMPMQVQASSLVAHNMSDLFNNSYLSTNFGRLYDPDYSNILLESGNTFSSTFNVVSSGNSDVIIDGSTSENTSRYNFDLQLSFFNNKLDSDLSYLFSDNYAYLSGVIQFSYRIYMSPSVKAGSRLSLNSSDLVLLDTVYSPYTLYVSSYLESSDNYGVDGNVIISFNNVEISNITNFLNLLSFTMNFNGYTAQSAASCNVTFEIFSFKSNGYIHPGPSPGSSVDIIEGYDDSAGNQVSSDFESGVNDYDQVEDNLFNTSTGALQGFEFFDFGSFSAVTSGLSFCSSLLTSIYENFGGINGIGIVISVLFSVLFMAIVIGLFRYYK